MPNKPTIESGLPSDEHREFIFNPEVFSLDKTTIQIFGVNQRLDNFEENKDNIKEIVGASKIVALECAPRALGLYSEQSRNELAKFLENIPVESMLQVPEVMQLAKKKGLKQISTHRQAADLIIEELPSLKFFSAVEEECLKAGKTILVADPDMSVSSIGDLLKNDAQKAFIKDSKLEREKILGILLFSLFGSISIAGEKTFKALRGAYKNSRTAELEEAGEAQTFSSESGASRREFMSGLVGSAFLAGAAGIAASSAASYKEARSFHIKDTTNRGRVNNPLGEFLVNYEDYRDVVLAEALKRVGGQATEPQILSVFYGESHRAAAAHYAKHDMERSLKLKAYQKLNKETFPVPKLRMFKPVNGQWGKKVETDLA